MSQHLQVYMSCMFGVQKVQKVMKYNNPGCSHTTAIFHFRPNQSSLQDTSLVSSMHLVLIWFYCDKSYQYMMYFIYK